MEMASKTWGADYWKHSAVLCLGRDHLYPLTNLVYIVRDGAAPFDPRSGAPAAAMSYLPKRLSR